MPRRGQAPRRRSGASGWWSRDPTGKRRVCDGSSRHAVAAEAGKPLSDLLHHEKGRRSCRDIVRPMTTRRPFEVTSKRRKGFPSETRVKRGHRVVHGDVELMEKLGRNDPCPCGSGRSFQAVLPRVEAARRQRARSLLSGSEPWRKARRPSPVAPLVAPPVAPLVARSPRRVRLRTFRPLPPCYSYVAPGKTIAGQCGPVRPIMMQGRRP